MTAREGWLLLFLSRGPLGVEVDDERDLDPIRIQKAMFLLSKRGPARDSYGFRAYNWGPFSREIYDDLESLVRRGQLLEIPVPGQTWRVYRTTPNGEESAEGIASNLPKEQVAWVSRVRDYVTNRSFNRLLREIYAEYPEYTRNSLFDRQ